MALIGTLRSKMGTWVVVFVFVAIAAFVLGDIFSGNSNILNWGRNSVGEINGKEITYEEYQSVIREREANYFLNFGREPGEREMPSIRQQAWDLLIARHAIEPQFEKVGVEVTTDEVWDMIQGKNVDQNVKLAFTNQETGQFDRDRIVSYLNQLKTMPEGSEARVRWELFQRDLKPSRERIKYENLLLKTQYITKAEAEREYHLQTDVAEVKYLFVPYYAMSDSVANVTDEDFKAYYNENKEKFKTGETRDIKYVSISVTPSADDSAAVKEDLARIVSEFQNAENDSTYAATHTEGQNAFQKYTLGSLPEFVTPESLTPGNVIGPMLDGNTYRIMKVSRVFEDTVSTARAKHILIKWADNTEAAKKDAKEKARNILKDLKGGASFADKAREFGTDGTASRGGDLGWFSTGQMVKPFESAVFQTNKPGLLNDVVETDYGYHIIEVTDVKTNKAYELAIVERQILPSDATTNEAFRKAETFATDLSGESEFDKRAKELGLEVLSAKNITPSDRRVGILGEARQIVQWLYRDASMGEISQVFDLQDQNVVAIMTGRVEEGYKSLEQVKAEIRPAVTNKVKAQKITEKLKASKGSLEEIAQAFGADANVYNSSDLKLNSNTLPTVGFDPLVVGTAFSLDNGKRSQPIAGETGVVIIEVQNKTIAPTINDFSTYKTQQEQAAYNRNSMNISEAIKDKADIEDKRYKFF